MAWDNPLSVDDLQSYVAVINVVDLAPFGALFGQPVDYVACGGMESRPSLIVLSMSI
jgi:hypothetical protein